MKNKTERRKEVKNEEANEEKIEADESDEVMQIEDVL